MDSVLVLDQWTSCLLLQGSGVSRGVSCGGSSGSTGYQDRYYESFSPWITTVSVLSPQWVLDSSRVERVGMVTSALHR